MNARAIAESAWFNRLSLVVILVSALLIGVETYARVPAVLWAQWACVAFFAAEVVVRFLGRRSTREYLADGWNWFDVLIVAAAFVPASNGLTPILRILRVLRVIRLVRTVPELRMIVSVLARSIISMKYIGLLAVIFFYTYAVIGVKLFGATQKEFATLHEALFTLLRTLTGDNWSDLRYQGLEHNNHALVTLYHASWILLGTFVLINLIVGAIINNYQQVQEIERNKQSADDASDERLLELTREIQRILAVRAARRDEGPGDSA